MNDKIGVVFSGQGAQYSGMGKELCERFSESEAIFDYSSQILGIDMKDMCFNYDDKRLSQTINTQPAMFTMEVACYAVLKKYGINPDVVAGYSLGEYSAFYASGIFDLMTCLYLVKQRAKAMSGFLKDGLYGMAAISGNNIGQIEEICEHYDNAWIANYNSHIQVTVTGIKEDVQGVISEADKLNFRTTFLNLNGPFHSPLMYDAAKEYENSIKLIRKNKANIPIILNVKGDYYSESDSLEEIMVKQIYSPVLWSKTIEKMIDDGVTCFIEIGPGKVLSKFIDNIRENKKITILNVENMESLSYTIDRIYS